MNYKHFQIGTLGANGDRKRFGCAVGGAVADYGENGRASKAAKRRLVDHFQSSNDIKWRLRAL